jgi:amidase
MADSSLWQLSACALSERLQNREISAVEAVTSAVERMREKNPDLNAVVDDMTDEALAEAARLDQVMATDGPIGPLHGVPITIKENIDQTGRATPNGVTAFKNVIAPANSPVVNNFIKAGAIVIGRTNTPEFSFRGTTTNELHGRTYNPWNDWASPGGSSGGAASAVMSGIGALAHGNDIGGSLRYPATATGAATVKPGLGRVPAYNPSAPGERGMLAQVMSSQGAIAREVKDVRLAMKSLIAYDAHDPWMVPMPFEGPAEDGPIKVAFTRNAFHYDLHPAVDKALSTARDALTEAGYELHEVEPPSVAEIAQEGAKTLFGEATVLMLNDVKKYGSAEFNAIFKGYSDYFAPYEGEDLLRAMARRSHYVRQWTLFLQDYPLVLTPFLLAPTFKWNRDTEGRDGIDEVMGAAMYSISMNYMNLPAGNIPANYNDGLPIGIQIVGRRFREDMILDACEAVEARVGIMAERLFERG